MIRNLIFFIHIIVLYIYFINLSIKIVLWHTIESLLSCHGQEKGMLEDMRFVINLLSEKLTFSLSSNAVFPIITKTWFLFLIGT